MYDPFGIGSDIDQNTMALANASPVRNMILGFVSTYISRDIPNKYKAESTILAFLIASAWGER
jgi:hypothetical protein